MTGMRRRLRLCAAAWLLFQTVSLTALVPRACCLAHRSNQRADAPDCHEPAVTHHCPMSDSPARRCAMHHEAARDTASRHQAADCSMRGTCEGPAATFLSLLANSGVLTEPFAVSPHLTTHTLAAHVRENPHGNPTRPDSPPPRA
jgi:hypothetical protein